MILNVKQFVTKIEKEKNINTLKKILGEFKSDTSICDNYINEGSFGRVYINRNPTKVTVEDDVFEYPVVKIEKESSKEDQRNDRYIVRNGYLFNITNNSMVGEALASAVLSRLFIDRITPHITMFLGHSQCSGKHNILYENLTYGEKDYPDFQHFINYVLNEKIDIDTAITTVLIQVFHTFMLLNERYSLIHFDFEDRNVFVKVPKKDEKYYGTDILSHDYLVYKIDKTKALYLKNPGFLIKIGDFGGSSMSVGKLVIQNNFIDDNNSIKLQEYYPKYPENIKKFLPDTYPFIRFLILKFGIRNKYLYRLATQVPILDTMLINEESRTTTLPNIKLSKNEVLQTLSPREILSSDIFREYHEEPSDMKNPLFINPSPNK